MKFFGKKKPPAYGTDFYRIENVVGCTSYKIQPHREDEVISAVYFDDGQRFGRITEVHPKLEWIGRMEIVPKYIQSRTPQAAPQHWSIESSDSLGIRGTVVVKDNYDKYTVYNILVNGKFKAQEGWVFEGVMKNFAKFQPVGEYRSVEKADMAALEKQLTRIIVNRKSLAPYFQ
jgi:hypothetical protein